MKKSLTVITICTAIVTLAAVLLSPPTRYAGSEHSHPYASAGIMIEMR